MDSGSILQLRSDRLLVTMFLAAISLPLVLSVLSTDKSVSESEKRTLAPKPVVSQLFSDFDVYRNSVEDYWEDHIGLRELLITGYSAIKVLVFKVSPNDLALLGRDKWIFYWGGGSNNYTADRDFSGRHKISRARLDGWYIHHMATLEHMRTKGAEYALFIAPNKQSIHPEFLPYKIRQKSGKTILDQFTEYLEGKNVEGFYDLRADLLALKQSGPVYMRTDTHWNHEGYVLAYRKIIEWARQHAEGIPVSRSDQDFELEHIPEMTGDLGGMVGFASYFAEPSALAALKVPCAEQVENIPLQKYGAEPQKQARRYRCKAATKRLLFIHDSFGRWVAPLLAEHFKETITSNFGSPIVLEELIEEFQPDIIVNLRVERQLLSLFPDYPGVTEDFIESKFEQGNQTIHKVQLQPEIVQCVNCDLRQNENGLEILSHSEDPFLEFDVPSLQNAGLEATVKVSVKSEQPDELKLYFATEDSPVFSEDNAVSSPIQKGANTIYLRIAAESPFKSLRLDPGMNKGLYYLNYLGIQYGAN